MFLTAASVFVIIVLVCCTINAVRESLSKGVSDE
jgi:hypothetical protein